MSITEVPALPDGVSLRIDGDRPPSAEAIAALGTACCRAEDDGGGTLTVVVSGAPVGSWTGGLDIALVTKWERALHRLERLGATTATVAVGECGGPALDVLLATDYRVATMGTRLVVPVDNGMTWPGMAVYRLVQQAGVARVRRAVLFGRPIEAGEALAAHLVDELAADLDGALAAVRAAVGRRPGPDVAIRRRLMLDATATSFENALGTHLAACDRTLRQATAGASA